MKNKDIISIGGKRVVLYKYTCGDHLMDKLLDIGAAKMYHRGRITIVMFGDRFYIRERRKGGRDLFRGVIHSLNDLKKIIKQITPMCGETL